MGIKCISSGIVVFGLGLKGFGLKVIKHLTGIGGFVS